MSHALYRFYGDTGQLLYVGITDNPQRRFGEHSKSKTWWEEVRGIAIEWYARRTDIEAAERRAISVEQPLHNKTARRRKLTVVPPASPLPWERVGLTAEEADYIESFECMWTAHWWVDSSAVHNSASPFRHDGRIYAWQPTDWPDRVLGLLGQEVPVSFLCDAVKLAYSRSDPRNVWADFFNMAALEELF